MTTRKDHIGLSQAASLALLDANYPLLDAVKLMVRNLQARPDTWPHPRYVTSGVICAENGNEPGVRQWIDSFR